MENPLKRFDIVVVGAGYVGLVTGATLSHLGHRVTCVDRDEERIRALKSGRLPFYEPGLEELVSLSVSAERLSFVDPAGLAGLLGETAVLFIAVDTPQNGDGSASLSSVAAIARDIGRSLSGTPLRKGPLLVVNKSTVPVGSGDYVSMLIEEGLEEAEGGKAREASFLVASNPEFLREGSACYDSFFPDRIVVGANSREAMDTLRALYEPIIEQSFPTELDPRPKVAVPFVTTDLASAEMIKYAANAFLATKISFANEMAQMCELFGADVRQVLPAIGADHRVGSAFLGAGIGWGGSCFSKDVAALIATGEEYGYTPSMLHATVEINKAQRSSAVRKLQRELHMLKGRRIALLGLTFKPGTDDLRDAPALDIARRLLTAGAVISAFDPVVKVLPEDYKAVRLTRDAYDAADRADAVVVITEWSEFRLIDPAGLRRVMRGDLVVDGRNCLP